MPAQEQLDPTGAKILDGAVRVLGDFGFKRATVELVAKYAGVSHMTIYRRWPSKNDLLTTAVISEFTTLLDAAFDDTAVDDAAVDDTAVASSTSFAERTWTAFADTVWAVQSHPLVLRELNTESGEQSPLLSSTSGAVMESSVPLVAERLRRLGTTTQDAPAELDSVADVFVRLAHSLVVVKRPGQPLTTRTDVGDYARECFGPYLQALAGLAGRRAGDAALVDLDQRRSSRNRLHRPHLQIAAASLVSVLALGAGLTAVLSGTIELPFITPAGISKPTNPAPPAEVAPGPTSGGLRATFEPQQPDPAVQPPSTVVAPSAARPAAEPATIPQIQLDQRSASSVGSIGGNSADADLPAVDNPVATPVAPPPVPKPGPGPGSRPPGPGPQPPSPKPPGPGPQPPGPKPPGPGPKPPGPGPQQPGPKPPGPGPQQPGPKPPGPGPQPNQQPGPSN